jgi:hypothetical protein
MATSPVPATKTRSLRSVRRGGTIMRGLLVVLAIVGIASAARMTIAPPKAPPAPPAPTVELPDAAEQGVAEMYARRYLTWETDRNGDRLADHPGFAGTGIDPARGVTLPRGTKQTVLWTRVVQQRLGAGPGEHVYTVAVQTDRSGLVYLAVTVRRANDGALSVVGYPAIIGQPKITEDEDDTYRDWDAVENAALSQVVTRALRNYLTGQTDDLQADLVPEAAIAIPGLTLQLNQVDDLRWTSTPGSVMATVTASDTGGATYTLRYQLDVVQGADGRWEISAIQMNPTAS